MTEKQLQETDDEKQTPQEGDEDAVKNGKKIDKNIKDKKVDGNSLSAVLGDYQIYCGEALPQYNVAENKAYRAVMSKADSGESLFAIVCERHVLPRRKAAGKYTAIVNPNLVFLMTSGKVYWPPARQERFVFIYKDTLGKVLLKPDAPLAMGWRQEAVLETVLHPMVQVLQDFRDRDFYHGAIRPSNMFESRISQTPKLVVLGDCLSMPPAYTQPAVYETIERSMANPISRGLGALADDLYSFGVTLAVFMRTTDPLEGLTDEQIIREKIRHGSYAAITGKDRFKGSILELLRGLLHDDPSQRWTIDEILVWMDGRRLSPKQAIKHKKATRPMSFAGEKYLYLPVLTTAIAKYPTETAKVVEDGSLEQWLERSLEDDDTVEKMQQGVTVSSDGGKGTGYAERLAANLSSVFDTMAPVRFRGLSMMGDGIGNALCNAVATKQDVKPFIDFFLQGVAMHWINNSENPNMDVGALISKFDSCRSSLRQSKSGFGLERCLYTLSSDAPCLSPKLEDYIVSNPEDMMYAFEDLCEKGDSPAFFLDRHSIAFLSVNDSKSIDSFLFDLNAPEEYKRVIAELKCLSNIQKRSKMPKFPHIGKTFLDSLPCVFERFHDQELKEKVQKEAEQAAQQGDLTRMLAAVNSRETQDKDFQAFRRAMVEFSDLREEYAHLEKQLANEKAFGKTTGREISALISGAIALLTIAVTTFMFFTDK